jgi:CDP-diacylglycerol--glycerol-3-phosphate 3-phosphatidyltransferase
MVSSAFKPAVTRVIEPIARALSRIGITPDAVTLFGTIGASASALILLYRGELFWAAVSVTLFALSDLFDGAIARVSERGASQWGGFLDSTCDRITDASILAGLTLYLVQNDDPLAQLSIASIVIGNLIPYIRAKAESYGIPCTVGIAERTERLGLTLMAIGLAGLGVPYALAIGMWALFVLGLITVAQRIWVVRKGLLSNE